MIIFDFQKFLNSNSPIVIGDLQLISVISAVVTAELQQKKSLAFKLSS
jgi:hypothetical protein